DRVQIEIVSLPFGSAINCARDPLGITTFPELSLTSLLILAAYFVLATGLAGMALSVRTFISVSFDSVCAQPEATRSSATLTNQNADFIAVFSQRKDVTVLVLSCATGGVLSEA